jgi:hypothetical protein
MFLLRNTFTWLRGFRNGGKKPLACLQYRAMVRQAETNSNVPFLESEIAKHQPTDASLTLFRQQTTPLESWPESEPDLFLPEDVPTTRPVQPLPKDAS